MLENWFNSVNTVEESFVMCLWMRGRHYLSPPLSVVIFRSNAQLVVFEKAGRRFFLEEVAHRRAAVLYTLGGIWLQRHTHTLSSSEVRNSVTQCEVFRFEMKESDIKQGSAAVGTEQKTHLFCQLFSFLFVFLILISQPLVHNQRLYVALQPVTAFFK